ncbi:hypothetical protein J4421_00740 [Candidatus Woesearchaeota archaeon]|nr:hypothetical protein [Candidatus Woesearchaeota archaeon]
MTIPKVISLEHLKKVRGVSFEDVVSILSQGNIESAICQEPQVTDKQYTNVLYFRDSRIVIFQGDAYKVCSLLPRFETIRGNRFSFKTWYELGPEFDIRQLDGPIVFREGFLVERVTVHEESTRESVLRYNFKYQ